PGPIDVPLDGEEPGLRRGHPRRRAEHQREQHHETDGAHGTPPLRTARTSQSLLPTATPVRLHVAPLRAGAGTNPSSGRTPSAPFLGVIKTARIFGPRLAAASEWLGLDLIGPVVDRSDHRPDHPVDAGIAALSARVGQGGPTQLGWLDD